MSVSSARGAAGRSETRVLIAGDLFSFPHGTGSTTRVLAIARGLLAAGADVRVLVTRYFGRGGSTKDREAAGVFEGIPFAYSTGTAVRPKTFVQRRLATARGVLGVAGPFVSLGDDPPDAVILFTGHTLALPLVSWLATRLGDAVLLFDGCEKPYVYEQESAKARLEERLYTPVMYRVYDGVFAISDNLVEYFSARLGGHGRVMRLPILVDVDRFTPTPGGRAAGPDSYLVYSGALAGAKGVHTLVQAFGAIAAQHPAVRLRISGSTYSSAYKERLVELAGTLGVSDRVDFVGMVPYEEYPRLLRDAAALVVPHAQGEFSEAAFPTKLGEYLASGTVTIASRVGEIDHYLRDGVDLHLVPPDDSGALAARLDQVLSHPDEAARIGANGRLAARRHFDYRRHGERLLRFIQDLSRRPAR